MRKKLFVVSDIHGHFTQFKEAIDRAGFDPENEEHLLVFCGDLFDRGTENRQVLEYFEKLENKVMIRGNHEDLLMEIFDTCDLHERDYANGTVRTVLELFGPYSVVGRDMVDFSGKNRQVYRICDVIEEMRDYFETEHYIFVHGWLPIVKFQYPAPPLPDWRNAGEEAWTEARWTKWTDVYPAVAPDGKTVVCGHVPCQYAELFDKSRTEEDPSIFYGDGMIAIDGGTYTSHQVNVLVLEDELLPE